MLQVQHLLGNRAVQRLLGQRKPEGRHMTLGIPPRPSERTADRVADQVRGLSHPGASVASTERGLRLQRTCQHCEGELRREPASSAAATPSISRLEASVQTATNGPGQSLSDASRAFFEPRLGHDFRNVRVHADAAAGRSAQELGARAYTVGRDIVFGEGEYAPETHRGQAPPWPRTDARGSAAGGNSAQPARLSPVREHTPGPGRARRLEADGGDP